MATIERTRTGEEGLNINGEVQRIGDRVIVNPRTRVTLFERQRGQRDRHGHAVPRGLRLRVFVRETGSRLSRG